MGMFYIHICAEIYHIHLLSYPSPFSLSFVKRIFNLEQGPTDVTLLDDGAGDGPWPELEAFLKNC